MKNTKNLYLYIAIALLAVVYFLKDKIFVGGGSSSGSSSSSGGETPINDTKYNTPPKDLYIDTWVKKGSSGTAVKEVQKLMNLIIDRCKQYNLRESYSEENPSSVERHLDISKSPKLTIDGVFGQHTENYIKYITGSKGTSKRIMQKFLNNWKSATTK